MTSPERRVKTLRMDATRPCEFPVSLSFRVRMPSCEKKGTGLSSSRFPQNLCWRSLRRCWRISLPSDVLPDAVELYCTSIIVAAELRYGADKKGSPRLASQLEAVLGALEILPFETPADRSYGLLRTRLEKQGTPIGANDLLIAAQALALGCVIVIDKEENSPGSRACDCKIGCALGNRSRDPSHGS